MKVEGSYSLISTLLKMLVICLIKLFKAAEDSFFHTFSNSLPKDYEE